MQSNDQRSTLLISPRWTNDSFHLSTILSPRLTLSIIGQMIPNKIDQQATVAVSPFENRAPCVIRDDAQRGVSTLKNKPVNKTRWCQQLQGIYGRVAFRGKSNDTTLCNQGFLRPRRLLKRSTATTTTW